MNNDFHAHLVPISTRNEILCRPKFSIRSGLGGALLSLLLSVLCSNANALIQPKEVSVTGGDIRGDRSSSVTYFRGIPYAAPPVGELRFRGPKPVVPWSGVMDTSDYNNACFAGISSLFATLLAEESQSEDCLYLNVTTPTYRGSWEKLPVMVWIHGGAWVTGSGGGLYDPKHLVNQGDVVVVTINYRLGVFGFGWHQALNNTEGGTLKGNYAIRDMVQSLEWVRDNITEFGGDRDNVTIFGESAGGWSVCNLLAIPNAAGLFDKAIIQSGGCPAMTEAEAQNVMDGVVTDLQCTGTDAEIRSCLQGASVEDLQLAATGDAPAGVNLNMASVVDGQLLPDHPLEVIESGQHNAAEVILGTNDEEIPAPIFIGVNSSAAYDDILASVFPSPVDRESLRQHYDLWQYGSYSNATAHLQTDLYFRCQSRRLAGALTASQAQDVYLYEFNLPVSTVPTTHGLDLLYLFANPTPLLPLSYDLHRDMLERWTSFARNGRPSGQWWEPTWHPYQTGNHARYRLGNILGMEYPHDDTGCDILDSLPNYRYMGEPNDWFMTRETPLMGLFDWVLDTFPSE